MRSKPEITTRRDEKRTVIAVSGDVDMDSSPRLLDAIRAGLKDVPLLEVSLKGVDYVDSSGIAVLVHGFKLARKEGVEYVVADPSPNVMAVIKLSQLDKFFTIKQSGTPPGGGE